MGVRKGGCRYASTLKIGAIDSSRPALSGSVFRLKKKLQLFFQKIAQSKIPMPKNSRFPVTSPTPQHMPRGWPGCCDCLPDTSRPYCYAQSTARDLLFQDMLSDQKHIYVNFFFFSIKVKYLGLTENDHFQVKIAGHSLARFGTVPSTTSTIPLHSARDTS